jgi:DNA-binding transcriptional MocR family regulator
VVDKAAAWGLSVSPGRISFPGEPPAPYLRISYGAADAAALVTGVRILAEAIAAS